MTVSVATRESSVDADRVTALRQVFGCFPTGVVVITTTGRDGPAGMTVSSYTSLSLRPPLVLFCAARESTTWPLISLSGRFVINVLARGQDDIARAFAQRGRGRFDGLRPDPSPAGLPVLPGVLAYLECEIQQRWPGGDHTVVVGQVRHAERLRVDAPLLHFHGQLH